MRKLLVTLAWIIILLMLVSAFGCSFSVGNNNNPNDVAGPGDSGTTDPGDSNPGSDPGDNPGPGENTPDDPGNSNDDSNQPPSYNLHSEVTPVPGEAAASIDRAVIRQGDLWLWSTDGRMWRQTDRGDVTEVIWAPDGHGLAYFCTPTMSPSDLSLFYLIPGNSPVLIDNHIQAGKTWNNKSGFVWSPDSTSLAYAVDGGGQMRIKWVADSAQTTLLLDEPLDRGPYWLSENTLVYSNDSERPSLIILNTMGDLLTTVPDTNLPYPVPNGLVAASGTYDPDAMESFYLTGLVRTDTAGSNPEQFYDRSPRFCLIARDPVLPEGLSAPRYFAISDGQTLSLHKYGGLPNKAYPAQVELLTQDLYLTFSEFCYPFWFSWAPDGSRLAALCFSFTQEGDFGEQEGYWDLVVVDKNGNWQTLNTLYYVTANGEPPVPFQNVLPLNWSSCGSYINYLTEREDLGYDLWKVNVSTSSTELVMEHCSLPDYRPLNP